MTNKIAEKIIEMKLIRHLQLAGVIFLFLGVFALSKGYYGFSIIYLSLGIVTAVAVGEAMKLLRIIFKFKEGEKTQRFERR